MLMKNKSYWTVMLYHPLRIIYVNRHIYTYMYIYIEREYNIVHEEFNIVPEEINTVCKIPFGYVTKPWLNRPRLIIIHIYIYNISNPPSKHIITVSSSYIFRLRILDIPYYIKYIIPYSGWSFQIRFGTKNIWAIRNTLSFLSH